MRKHSFYTLCRTNRRATAILVDGFYDKDTELNYYKSNSGTWFSVCILTGLAVAYGRTRKECVSKTIEALPAYKDMRTRPLFNERVERYNEAVKIALMTR